MACQNLCKQAPCLGYTEACNKSPTVTSRQGLVNWTSGLDSGLDLVSCHTPFSIFPKGVWARD